MSMEAYFQSAAARARESAVARHSDLAIVAGIVAIVALMIVPLPTFMIDFLVAMNIAFGVILLLVAIYISSALEFSVFPSILLISTLFRLALSIATTRLILLEGDAGQIINTFGTVVAGGNIVVGLVVFLIITVVQFIVIAKGAERVAEVAARFTLDGMPGKQLSIDSDLRSGLIDKEGARERRRTLEMESKLHGSLDGAMKFVKGDAIASIVIIVINLLGGLAVGVLQQGMEMSQAMAKYSVLTIGDGLVAQIPALLGAMSAGLIVTRTTDEERDKHLGDAVRKQLTGKPRVLFVAGGICWMLALVPGFPATIFVALGAVAVIAAVLLTPSLRTNIEQLARPAKASILKDQTAKPALLAAPVPAVKPMVPLLLELNAQRFGHVDPRVLTRAVDAILDQMQLKLGLALPGASVHLTTEPDGPFDWRLLAFEVPIGEGTIDQADPVPALSDAVRGALRRNVALFLGIQETSALLTRASGDYPDVIKEVVRALPIPKLADVLRRLVEEEVGLRDVRSLLEGLAEAAQREKETGPLVECARIALRRHLSHRHAPDGTLRALLLDPALEEHLRKHVQVGSGAQQLAIEPALAKQLIERIATDVAETGAGVVLTTIDLRRHIRKLIEPDLFEVAVLSFHELMPALKLDVAGRVQLPLPGAPQLTVAD